KKPAEPAKAKQEKPAAKPADADASEELRPAESTSPTPAANRPAPFSPANDDRQKDYRLLLQGMNRRVPTTVYWMVALLSVLWIGGGILLGNMVYGSSIWQVRSVSQLLAAPQLIGLVVAILVPVMMFWGFGVMIRRAQEMRLTARSMAEVAMRLAEPENLAQDRVMTVGQAVRREVQAMGEGIERTLARAVELDTLVHAEVSELERAYSVNEIRIRTLVDGLGSERDAVVSHAERLRASIAGAHETLKEELAAASDALAANIRDASTHLSATVTPSGDSLVDRINFASSSIYEAIDQRLDVISDRITTSGDAFASLLDSRIATLTQSTDEVTRTLSEMLEERTGGMIAALGGATQSLGEQFDTRLAEIHRILTTRGAELISEFETRAEALDVGTRRLNTALDERARQINETLVERAREIATTFTDARHDISALIDEGKAKIGSEMAELVMSTSTMLDGRAEQFANQLAANRDRIAEALQADLDRLAEARASIDATVHSHVEKLSEGR